MPNAALAPPGVFCAVHQTVTGATICARCGSFMCADCSQNNRENMCPACRAKVGLDVPALARAYKSLVLWFGVELLLTIFNSAMSKVPLVGAFVALGLLVTLVMLAVYAYRTSRALGSSVGWLWAVAMLVPCANVITLLVLSSKATSACRERGIEVGFLGPKL